MLPACPLDLKLGVADISEFSTSNLVDDVANRHNRTCGDEEYYDCAPLHDPCCKRALRFKFGVARPNLRPIAHEKDRKKKPDDGDRQSSKNTSAVPSGSGLETMSITRRARQFSQPW